MRPTWLDFRSPREKTPAPYFPALNRDGQKININKHTYRKGKVSLPQEQRFLFTDKANVKTCSDTVGPGSYIDQRDTIATKKIPGGKIYKQFHGKKETWNNGFYYHGQHLVYDESMTLPHTKTDKIQSEANSIAGSQRAERIRERTLSPRSSASSAFNKNVNMWQQFGTIGNSPGRTQTKQGQRSRLYSPSRGSPSRGTSRGTRSPGQKSPRMASVKRHRSPYLEKHKKRRSTSQMQTILIKNGKSSRESSVMDVHVRGATSNESSMDIQTQARTTEYLDNNQHKYGKKIIF